MGFWKRWDGKRRVGGLERLGGGTPFRRLGSPAEAAKPHGGTAAASPGLLPWTGRRAGRGWEAPRGGPTRLENPVGDCPQRYFGEFPRRGLPATSQRYMRRKSLRGDDALGQRRPSGSPACCARPLSTKEPPTQCHPPGERNALKLGQRNATQPAARPRGGAAGWGRSAPPGDFARPLVACDPYARAGPAAGPGVLCVCVCACGVCVCVCVSVCDGALLESWAATRDVAFKGRSSSSGGRPAGSGRRERAAARRRQAGPGRWTTRQGAAGIQTARRRRCPSGGPPGGQCRPSSHLM